MQSFLSKQHLLKQDFQIIEAISVWYVFPRELIFQFYLAWREDMLEKSKENSKDGLKSLLSQNFEAFFWAIHAFVLIVFFFDHNKLGKASRQFWKPNDRYWSNVHTGKDMNNHFERVWQQNVCPSQFLLSLDCAMICKNLFLSRNEMFWLWMFVASPN